MSLDGQNYLGREQTLVKHIILQRYLLRLAAIVGTWAESITYIDCFSGPWESKTADFSDTSFGIAVQELKKAQAELAKHGKHPRFRCFFLERESKPFAKLKSFCGAVSELDAVPHNGDLENSVPTILNFYQHGGKNNFAFTFIDPTGWTGFEMDTIRPLLQLKPGEVLINYMTSFIRRFIESKNPELVQGFDRLYGGPTFRSKLASVAEQDRDDAMVEEYIRQIKSTGDFQFVCYTPVFQPQINDIHFHLIYATRNEKGLEVFKKEEHKAVEAMESARAKAQQRERESGGTLELLSSEEMHDTQFYNSLRTKYWSKTESKIRKLLSPGKPVIYDLLWEAALITPLVWVEDLNKFLLELKKGNKLKLIGLGEREKFPKQGKGVLVQMI
jgi:three-Cys-motif partner protein